MTALRVPPMPVADGPNARPGLRLLVLPAVVAAAWLLVVIGQATGSAVLVHQHDLPAVSATPLLVALIAFLLTWQVMIAATMLPASLRWIRVVDAAGNSMARPHLGISGFLIGYLAVWSAFGALAFLGDTALQRAVAAVPWLAARPWLPSAAVVALAAAYQFTPLKRRSLAACRHPARLVADRTAHGTSTLRLGFEHGLACVGCAWALMLVMVVAGLGDLWWMAALTAVMVYEATGRQGRRAASVVGLLLLWMAALIVLPGWLPA